MTGIFLSKLGYEAPVRSEPGPSGSRLSATNEERVSGPPEFPVDDHCQRRLETLAEKQPWTAFSSFQERAVRVAEGHWETLFKPPSVSDETRNKVRAEQGLVSGMFRDSLRKKSGRGLVPGGSCRPGRSQVFFRVSYGSGGPEESPSTSPKITPSSTLVRTWGIWCTCWVHSCSWFLTNSRGSLSSPCRCAEIISSTHSHGHPLRLGAGWSTCRLWVATSSTASF